jgi:type III secretory pathway component EscT
MDELVPVIFGGVLGVLIWRGTAGYTRMALSVLAVLASGATATVMSGEYTVSWIYILLDLGEAALGLAVGVAIAHLFWRRRDAGTTSSPRP